MKLAGKIALVAGATRGAGRAIALELALAGATVYATGRSSGIRSGVGGPFELATRRETIEETEGLVRAAGGVCHGLVVDHTDAAQVQALLTRIAKLDILVNDIWGGDELAEWGKGLAELDLERGRLMLERAVWTHVITARAALPLLRESRGVLVEVTDGAGHFYRGNVFYDLAKTQVIRLAFGLAESEKAVRSLVVTPGFLRSEAMLDHFGVTEETWRDAVGKDPHFAYSETPRYVARGITGLVADGTAVSGKGFSSAQLARRYGFTDVDGTRPDFALHAMEEEFGLEQVLSGKRFAAMFEE